MCQEVPHGVMVIGKQVSIAPENSIDSHHRRKAAMRIFQQVLLPLFINIWKGNAFTIVMSVIQIYVETAVWHDYPHYTAGLKHPMHFLQDFYAVVICHMLQTVLGENAFDASASQWDAIADVPAEVDVRMPSIVHINEAWMNILAAADI